MRIRLWGAVLTVLTLGVLGAGCGSDDGSGAADDSPVDLAGDWVLTSGTTADGPLVLAAGHDATLTVDGDQVSGQSACNRFMGQVTVSGDSVSFGQLGGTQMACMPASVMELEQAYLAALAAVDTGARDGDVLTLTGPSTSLVFEPVPPVVPAELVGTTWTLESVIDGDSVSSVLGQPAPLTLSEDASVAGATGCRTLRGKWALDDDSLSVTDIATTKQACPGALAEQDELVLAVLGGPAAVTLDGATLTLTLADGTGLGYRAS
jgi:heat shock protein HslJ